MCDGSIGGKDPVASKTKCGAQVWDSSATSSEAEPERLGLMLQKVIHNRPRGDISRL